MTSRIYHVLLTIGLVFSVICGLERPAHAYVDPGSGLLAYQTLSAFVAGVFFYFRQRIHNALRSVRGQRGPARPTL